jgi:hypothetical protein
MVALLLCCALASGVPSPALTLADEMTAQGGKGDAGGWGMALYARAFTAYALTNDVLDGTVTAEDAAPRLDALVDGALHSRVMRHFQLPGVVVAQGTIMSQSVAHLGHVALMLTGKSLWAPLTPRQQTILDGITRALAHAITASPNHLLPTYGTRVWPADNEVALAALALQGHPAAALVTASLDALEGAGLPPSELKPRTLNAKDVPRGCALSWSVGLRALHAPQQARALYVKYRDAYWTGLGPVVGFREWPRGVDRPSDVDSGPIILGIGVAASGIGLGAARAVGETGDAEKLSRSASLAGLGFVEDQRGKGWLMRGMAAWARNARVWRR